MAAFEVNQPDYTSDLRYENGFSTNYSVGPDGIPSGLNYNHEFDWTQHHDGVYAPRAMYPVQDTLEQQHSAYLGYSSIPQGDMAGLPTASYISPTEMTLSTPLSQMSYTGHENYYAQQYIPISPTSTASNSSGSSTGTGTTGQKPKRKRVQSVLQRKAANVRERRRMFHLNEAFDELRKRLPAFNYEKRLSRIETLRLAMTYIAFMKDVSDGKEPDKVQLLEIQRKSEQQFQDSPDSD